MKVEAVVVGDDGGHTEGGDEKWRWLGMLMVVEPRKWMGCCSRRWRGVV